MIATTLGTLLIVTTVNIQGISLMGSAGFLIVFAAVNLAATRLVGGTLARMALSIAGAVACAGSLAALIAYTGTHNPAELGVLGGLLAVASVGESILHARRHSGD